MNTLTALAVCQHPVTASNLWLQLTLSHGLLLCRVAPVQEAQQASRVPRLLFTLVPCVLVTRVLPTLRVLNTEGALTSYQSFLAKGSVLHSTGDTGQSSTT